MNRDANLQAQMVTEYAIIRVVRAGEEVEMISSNEAGDWLQLAGGAWTAASLITRETGGDVAILNWGDGQAYLNGWLIKADDPGENFPLGLSRWSRAISLPKETNPAPEGFPTRISITSLNQPETNMMPRPNIQPVGAAHAQSHPPSCTP